MDQFVQFIQSFMTEQMFYTLALLLGAIIVGFGSALIAAARKSEKYSQYIKLVDHVDDMVFDVIVFIESGQLELDQSYYDESERLAGEGYIIDPRMLYLVEAVQEQVKRVFGYNFDFVEMHRKAEAIYQLFKKNN